VKVVTLNPEGWIVEPGALTTPSLVPGLILSTARRSVRHS